MTDNNEKSIQLRLSFDDPIENENLLLENIRLRNQNTLLMNEIERLNKL